MNPKTMENMSQAKRKNIPILYRVLRRYVKFMLETFYYKKTYCIGAENVTDYNTPTVIASNHQNALNDALGIMMNIMDRKVRFMVRADIFAVSKGIHDFLIWLGLLPAYRIDFEGEAAVANNGASFQEAEDAIREGHTVTIYPEAGHQDKHWLGTFTYGYTKMAFEAAEADGFTKDVKILPACNHYSDYFGLGTEMLVRFGTPISLQPYYELYKEKPRTAQRQVNKAVREQIDAMMLNVKDVEHYRQIDYIRTSAFGRRYAQSQGIDPDNLPQRLESDKKLVDTLAQADTQELYDDTQRLLDDMEAAKITEKSFQRSHSLPMIALRCLGLLALLPVAVFCLWPSFFVYWIAEYFSRRKKEDPMLRSSFLIAISVVFTLPLFSLISLIVVWAKFSFLAAIIYVALFPAFYVFEWHYNRWCKDFFEDIRCHKAERKGLFAKMMALREKIFNKTKEICQIEL